MKVFISFDIEQRPFVAELTRTLRSAGVTPIVSNLALVFGDELFDKLDQALQNPDYLIVVLSDSYMKSEWLQKELLAFLVHETKVKKKLILPIVIGSDNCEIPLLLKERVIDFRGISFEEGFEKLLSFIATKGLAFVVMKFGDEILDSAYKGAIRQVLEEFNYSVVRIDEIQDGGMITDQMLEQIKKSEIVVADLTGERPNCYYEAGYAHSLGKEIIFTIQQGSTIHFDLHGYRFIVWKTEEELRKKLRERLKAIQDKISLRE